jgi:hypothetical protein
MRTGCSLPAMVGAVGLKSENQLDGVHTAGPGTVGGRWIPDLSVPGSHYFCFHSVFVRVFVMFGRFLREIACSEKVYR